MIIRQETFGWNFRESEEQVMQKTKRFLSQNRYKTLLFSVLLNNFMKAFGEKLENHFVYIVLNNLCKACFNKDKGKITQKVLPEDIQKLIDNHLNELLLKETQIIQPKIMLFLTGSAYDKYIKPQLEKA